MDKPAGPTSHDVVQRVRRALATRAVGHTGTLDPFATGLLVVLVGRATRLARFVEAEAKTYLATVRLGFATDTDDRTGTPLGPPADLAALDPASVADAVAALEGAQRQRPPQYSAKHVEGERSYRLARRGVAVELAEAAVVVHRIELVSSTLPELVFRATVSAGTYIRALARDLGERLGVGGHLTALRREAIGALRVEDAIQLGQIDASALRPARAVLGHLPALELDEPSRAAVSHGRALLGEGVPSGDVALTFGGELVAIARAGDGWLRPSVVLDAP